MQKTTVVILTLLVYQLLLLGIGWWAKSRNQNAEDFFLGGRGLGPVVAAISYSSSASSAWTLLGVSGIAYVMGVSAIWIAAGSFTGMLVAWFWIAPRLMKFSRDHGQITLTDVLVHDAGAPMRRAIVVTASAIIVFSFTFYVNVSSRALTMKSISSDVIDNGGQSEITSPALKVMILRS